MAKNEKTVDVQDKEVAYKQVFASPEGQIVLADLIRRFGFTRKSPFVEARGEPHNFAFLEGGRAVMIYIGLVLDGEIRSNADDPEMVTNDLFTQTKETAGAEYETGA